jgi:RNA polymerase sigma factor (sigma-70 family)
VVDRAIVDERLAAVLRDERGRLTAALVRILGDWDLAEELVQDAAVAALEHWATDGVPDNPGAWLMAVAKRRAIDDFRRRERHQRKLAELGRELATRPGPAEAEPAAALDADDIGDDLLRLVFMACHPVLSTDARVALTLRVLGGLTTEEIARGFLVPEPTLAQRIVRAKRTLADRQVRFEVPGGAELPERLSSVLEVIYLIFNEGYTATAGADWIRPALCEEALRLGRILAELIPAEPEVHGLVALMEIQASRLGARTGPSGEPIRLLDQNRARWNRLLIRRGLAALERAEQLAALERADHLAPPERPELATPERPEQPVTPDRTEQPVTPEPVEQLRVAPGQYRLQAEIAACHARAATPEETDWVRIAALYQALAQLTASPVVELNRAVAVAMAFGPEAGLKLVDRLPTEPALRGYHLLPSVRGDLLARLRRFSEARGEFERAAELTRNARERELLLARARACGPG